MPKTQVAEPDLTMWTVEETAARLGISRAHLYKLVADQQIGFVRVGRIRFRPQQVADFLASRERGGK
jgi:excisionase family DNA binding protein